MWIAPTSRTASHTEAAGAATITSLRIDANFKTSIVGDGEEAKLLAAGRPRSLLSEQLYAFRIYIRQLEKFMR